MLNTGSHFKTKSPDGGIIFRRIGLQIIRGRIARDGGRRKCYLKWGREALLVGARCTDGDGTEPTQELDGREALTPVFNDLNKYEATTHFNGQSTIALDGNRATGESYCLAHHLFTDNGKRKLMVASLRYHDTFSSSTAPGCSPSASSTSTGPRLARRSLSAGPPSLFAGRPGASTRSGLGEDAPDRALRA